MSLAEGYHATRFAPDARRETVWRTLVRYYFARYIGADASVLDLGCGYGHFINNVRAKRRIAVDQWAGFPSHIAGGIETRVGDVTDLGFLEDGSIDFALASNVFEHITVDSLRRVLEVLRKKLTPGGVLAILQPNYRYAYREYFDDYTHVSVHSDVSMRDLLEASGFEVIRCVPRFLPLSVKTSRAVWPWLIRLYLWLPFKPLGKQMLLLARRAGETSSGASLGRGESG